MFGLTSITGNNLNFTKKTKKIIIIFKKIIKKNFKC